MTDDSRNLIWVEKHRPQTLSDFVCSDSYRKKFEDYVRTKDIPNLLLVGTQGTGKTSLARIFVKSIPCDHMYINASEERGFDVLKTKVKDFAYYIGTEGLKICILDEFDGTCLDPETEIVIGTIEDHCVERIKNITAGCNIVSFNLDTRLLENDYCVPMNNPNDLDVYEIVLETGKKILCTADHPFFVENNGVIVEKKLRDLKENDEIIRICSLMD